MRALIIFFSASALFGCAGSPSTAASSDPTATSADKADGVSPPPANWVAATDTNLEKGTLSWKCKGSAGGYQMLSLVHSGKAVWAETVEAYDVIKDGAQVADQSAASTVFNIKVGAPVFHEGGQQVELTASLQDYSDILSWQFILQANTDFSGTTYSGVALSTFESSDGDDLLHPSAQLLSCKVQIGQ
jgi:hypothetical protein